MNRSRPLLPATVWPPVWPPSTTVALASTLPSVASPALLADPITVGVVKLNRSACGTAMLTAFVTPPAVTLST